MDISEGMALAGVRVLDLSEGIAGQFASRVLADFGADVYLVEPQSGSRLRTHWPVGGDGTSLLFRHLNTGKQSVRLDPDTPSGAAALRDLAAAADVAIVDSDSTAATLRAANPGLVACVVTDFATDGPYAGWRGSAMIHEALSGLMYSTGEADREPLYGFGHRPYHSAGAAAVSAIMAALIERQGSGLGETVAVNVHQTAAAMGQNLVATYSYNGYYPPRGRYPGACDLFKANDGWIVVFCPGARWAAMCMALDAPDLAGDPLFANPESLSANWEAARDRLAVYLREMSTDEIARRVVAGRAAAARVIGMGDLLADPHLAARDFWEKIETRDGERLILGPIFRMEGTPRIVRGPEPEPGSFPVERIAGLDRRVPPRGKESKLPLAGVRVVEFTTAWAGPFTGKLLAACGAEVIKIESLGALDLWRGTPTGSESLRYPDRAFGPRPYNRSSWFNSQNQNKLSLEVDLKSEADRESVERLIASSDVVVSNFASGVLQRLGFGYERLRNIREDIILLEMPAFGEGGPLSAVPGLGPTMEALAGITAQTGYGDGVPQRTGPAFVDPISGLSGAMAVLIALFARSRSGKGQRIELAQREGLLHWFGEWLLLHAEAGGVPAPDGNRVPFAAPHDVFRTAGKGEWVAVSVETDRQWAGFCEVIGRPELADDPRFASLELRVGHAAALRSEIEANMTSFDRWDIARRLQERGVAAAPVCSGKDVHDDPQLAAIGFYVELDHPEAGRHRYHGLPFRFSRLKLADPTPAPCLGQHTRQLLEAGLADLHGAVLKKAGSSR